MCCISGKPVIYNSLPLLEASQNSAHFACEFGVFEENDVIRLDGNMKRVQEVDVIEANMC